jgi:hypothetical protein
MGGAGTVLRNLARGDLRCRDRTICRTRAVVHNLRFPSRRETRLVYQALARISEGHRILEVDFLPTLPTHPLAFRPIRASVPIKADLMSFSRMRFPLPPIFSPKKAPLGWVHRTYTRLRFASAFMEVETKQVVYAGSSRCVAAKWRSSAAYWRHCAARAA